MGYISRLFENIRLKKHHGKCMMFGLVVLSFIVFGSVFWCLRQPGIALTNSADCGYKEHVHTEACYAKKLICDSVSAEHIHSDECYDVEDLDSAEDVLSVCEFSLIHEHNEDCYETELICTKFQHVHTSDCYSDKEADLETMLDWQEMFAGYITGNVREDLVKIAKSQVGYSESSENWELDENGVRRGYTRYGAWYGLPYADWSAMFVSFCLHYAGMDSESAPYNIGAESMAVLWDSIGKYTESEEYTPLVGDLIFFIDNTVGIVSNVGFDSVTFICGDYNNSVCEKIVDSYDESIVGYGCLVGPESYSSSFFGIDFSSEAFVLESCTCSNEGSPAISHADSCAYKMQLMELAESDVEYIYSVWYDLPSDAQEYLLEYLTWHYATKADDLKALIGSGTGSKSEINASCGTTEFTMSGTFSDTVELTVEKPDIDEDSVLSFLNPNIKDSVKWFELYNIVLTDNGKNFTSSDPVTVSVSFSNLTFDSESEFFAVAHLDSVTGDIIDSRYVDVEDNSITFTAYGFSPYLFYTVSKEVEGGERVLGTNWIDLKNSGFFDYWEQFIVTDDNTVQQNVNLIANTDDTVNPSDIQIDERGGETVSDDGKVVVSKTIDGTDTENVFDITLTVKTEENISEIYEEPDIAVVIVMDISATMKENFGGTSRYAAAMEAAETFLDEFVKQTGGVSKIGYVAFNTNAYEIFSLQECSTQSDANVLKNKMRQETGKIINANGYASSHSRFTNIEAGLKMGFDMLASVSNENKYLVFLSDGFPTTYISSGYNGYDPYTSSGTPGSNGVFYDGVIKYYCDYGTSYSDKAAKRASDMAAKIKESGVKIFSIGIDVGGQTIQQYIERGYDKDNKRFKKFSVVDCGNGNYSLSDSGVLTYSGVDFQIGNAESSDSYKNWLKNSIGSGYYYDSTNIDGLKDAYNKIFAEIIKFKEESSKADWVSTDPLPSTNPEYLDFIGFYDINGNLVTEDLPDDEDLYIDLDGSNTENGENTVEFIPESNEILWDLKVSGYKKITDGNSSFYLYKLVYRVRLKNEESDFIENKIYDTNDPTSLTYRLFESINGETVLSEKRTVNFKIPVVHGFLVDFKFKKTDSYGRDLAGAEFMLTHDTESCDVCRGDLKNSVGVQSFVSVSDNDGSVVFSSIPSGHIYLLRETKAPPGYVGDSSEYRIVVSYDELTTPDGWNGTIVNATGFEFPSTGGWGTGVYITIGTVLIVSSFLGVFVCRKGRNRRVNM